MECPSNLSWDRDAGALVDHPTNSLDDAEIALQRRWFLYCRLVGFAAIGLLIVTHRLWVPGASFPSVPLVAIRGLGGGDGVVRDSLRWFSFVAMLGSATAFCLIPRLCCGGRARGCGYLWGIGFFLAVVVNQHTLQPWAYHFTAVFLLAATAGLRTSLFWIRCLVVGIYLWSALGKFDVQFVETVGSQMVGKASFLLGIGEAAIEPATKVRIAVLLPLWELCCAMLLVFSRTRAVGVVGAVLMHCGLLLILGPLGMGHKSGVLIWNGLFIAQAIVLFWPDSRALQNCNRAPVRVSEGAGPLNFGVLLVLVMLVIPVGERVGWTDHWPSWALYAPHSSRATMWVADHGLDSLPEALRACIEKSEMPNADGWVRVPLDQWSLETLGVPIYPQARFQLGVAIAVAEAAGLDREVQVELRSQASRMTGERETQWLRGLPELRKAAAGYRLNALPWRFELRGFPWR